MNKEFEYEDIKLVRNVGDYLRVLLCIMSGFYALNLLFNHQLFDGWEVLQFIFFSLVSVLMYDRVCSGIENGHAREGYQLYVNIFMLNTTVQFLSCFHKIAWLLYAVLPFILLVPLFQKYQKHQKPDPRAAEALKKK